MLTRHAKISRIETFPIAVEVTPFTTSYGIASKCHSVVVKVYIDNGLYGIGEAPLWVPNEMGETLVTVVNVIDEHLSPILIGQDPREIGKIHHTMDAAIRGQVLAKAAIDIALYDLVGKIYDTPVYKLLGGGYQKEFTMVGCVGVEESHEAAKDAKKWVDKGCKVLKIKLPGVSQEDPAKSTERVALIRETVGKDITLIVDLNQGWIIPSIAINAIRRLREYDVLVEQPIVACNYEGFLQIARSVDVPLIADESAFTLEGVMEIIKRGAPLIINIKTTRPGGLYKAHKIMELAIAGGLECQIDDVMETKIATTAASHLAASVPSESFFCFSSGSNLLWLKKEVVKEGGLIVSGAVLKMSEAPGLGCKLDDEAVRECLVSF